MRSRILAFAAGCVLCGVALGQGPHVFSPLPGGVSDGDVPHRRARTVRPDLGLLRASTEGSELKFNLFDDVALSARVTSAAWHGTYLVVRGVLPDEPEGTFLAVVGTTSLSAEVRSARRGSFDIQHVPGGDHIVREVDETRWKPCACGAEHEADGGGTSPPAPRGTPTIRVMVVYTAQARDAQGGEAAIQGRAVFAIAQANQAYLDSQAEVQLELAYTGLVDYAESDSASTDLSRLRSRTDGYMDEVHCLRTLYGADMVALLVNNFNACGIAYLMVNPGADFERSAFSVTDKDCINGYTFAHELGHNMGCAHDRDNAGNAAFSYAYGYRTPGAEYRTILAYSPGQRIGRFSNPNISYNGHVMGIPLGQPDETYNALAITNTSPVIAEFRGEPRPPIDFNQDGSEDQGDVACLILAIAGDTSCSDLDPDFNQDGSADQGDIAALILLVAGGPACP